MDFEEKCNFYAEMECMLILLSVNNAAFSDFSRLWSRPDRAVTLKILEGLCGHIVLGLVLGSLCSADHM